eukprot:TRINITY_DN122276_c0_g1_i1.p1 TRINITY_DN122276_c0_g1~~TRINITY_DN122276_c0_g1_i1.p1  ORF type:complete len:595 (+),score=125.01 TRINITY_DN122276_c0_g1_i1:67-1851(+)
MSGTPKYLWRLAAALALAVVRGNAGTIPIDRRAEHSYEAAVRKANRRFQEECRSGAAEHAAKCKEQEIGRRYHAFEQRVSDRLPLTRAIPDSRPEVCGSKDYAITATVSVIIPFYHEATSTLLRTATSVLKRTPKSLLLDVILVSDGADAPWAAKQKEQIRVFKEKHGDVVKFIEIEKHLGLAPAKVVGAKASTAEIVAFLDSHCEVNIGWYEPLAAAIQKDRGTVANPIIDGISLEDFSYHSTRQYTRGVFTWGMYYAGEPFGPEDQAALERGEDAATPVMPGGLFAVDRKFFESLGFYDESLRVWGGENIELSLKAWRCGGRVVFVPCSRVGHVYKAVDHRFPRGESLHKNYKRIAEIWLDDYKEIYYKSFPIAMITDAGDLTEVQAVRDSLNCKSVDWFIEHVYPTLFIPKPVVGEGLLRSQGKKALCLDTGRTEIASNPMQDPHVARPKLDKCEARSDYNQWYFMQDTGRLVHIGIWTEECLGVKKSSEVVICQCAKYPGSGCSDKEIRWTKRGAGQFVHDSTGTCLAQNDGGYLQMKKCAGKEASKAERDSQYWYFEDRRMALSRQGINLAPPPSVAKKPPKSSSSQEL